MAGRRSSSRALTHVVLDSFNGGITAQRDKVNIQRNQMVGARNILWDEVGGFFCRKGVGPLTYGSKSTEVWHLQSLDDTINDQTGWPTAFFHFLTDPHVLSKYISEYFVGVGNGSIGRAIDFPEPGGGWGTLILFGGAPVKTAGPPVFIPWTNRLYITAGSKAATGSGTGMFRYDPGVPPPTIQVATQLGKAFNEDIANPVGGNMPCARFGAVFAERMWTAVMVSDTGVIDGSRVRWSHPGQPEDWMAADFVDVGQQGDTITAIAPMRDMLVVFKNSSMYAILGSGATSFRVVTVSGTIGSSGEWTRDRQGSILFWDPTIGLCRFDGQKVVNLFEPLTTLLNDRFVTQCMGVATDGERCYVMTDFVDFTGDRVPDPPLSDYQIGGFTPGPGPIAPAGGLDPSSTLVSVVATMSVAALAAYRWSRTSVGEGTVVWVFHPNAGWTSFSYNSLLNNQTFPASAMKMRPLTMLGELRARVGSAGDVDTNRRIVIGLRDSQSQIVMSDRYDDGYDLFRSLPGALPAFVQRSPIDAWYMSPWLHGGLPAQIKRWKAPRIIQESDAKGVLFVDVYYDFNSDFLRRTLRIDLTTNAAFDSYAVNKPGTIGRAKAVQLVFRPEHPRHWGIASVTIPLHPKVLR